jgi:hypothetical protein
MAPANVRVAHRRGDRVSHVRPSWAGRLVARATAGRPVGRGAATSPLAGVRPSPDRSSAVSEVEDPFDAPPVPFEPNVAPRTPAALPAERIAPRVSSVPERPLAQAPMPRSASPATPPRSAAPFLSQSGPIAHDSPPLAAHKEGVALEPASPARPLAAEPSDARRPSGVARRDDATAPAYEPRDVTASTSARTVSPRALRPDASATTATPAPRAPAPFRAEPSAHVAAASFVPAVAPVVTAAEPPPAPRLTIGRIEVTVMPPRPAAPAAAPAPRPPSAAAPAPAPARALASHHRSFGLGQR